MSKAKFNLAKVGVGLLLIVLAIILILRGSDDEEAFPLDSIEEKQPEPLLDEELVKEKTDVNWPKAKENADVNWPKAMEVPAQMTGVKEQLLKRDGYWASYNKDRKVPNWVAWHLTAAHTRGGNQRDDITFEADYEVPFPRATDEDYFSSKYDRGHMCPAGDNKWDRRALMQTFKFSNICPQNHSLNKGDWNDLEMQSRYWAREMGDIYIVTGPIFYNGVKSTIGKNKVAVPDAFFKVLLCDNRKAKAIGFVYPNRGGHKEMTEYVKSVDEIEKITGIDFFPKLEDALEEKLESASKNDMIDQWKVYKNKPNNFGRVDK